MRQFYLNEVGDMNSVEPYSDINGPSKTGNKTSYDFLSNDNVVDVIFENISEFIPQIEVPHKNVESFYNISFHINGSDKKSQDINEKLAVFNRIMKTVKDICYKWIKDIDPDAMVISSFLNPSEEDTEDRQREQEIKEKYYSKAVDHIANDLEKLGYTSYNGKIYKHITVIYIIKDNPSNSKEDATTTKAS